MPIKTTLQALDKMLPSLAQLAKLELPARTSVGIARRIQTISAELENYKKLLIDLFKAYGTVVGEQITVSPESSDYGIFLQKKAELDAVEVVLNFDPIQISELEAATCKGHDLIPLLDIIGD